MPGVDELTRLPDLTRDEYETLLLMLGFATGAAVKENNNKLAVSFLRLANKINENNPRWIRYEIPQEQTDGNQPQQP